MPLVRKRGRGRASEALGDAEDLEETTAPEAE